jgi:hypothetical protein
MNIFGNYCCNAIRFYGNKIDFILRQVLTGGFYRIIDVSPLSLFRILFIIIYVEMV